MRRALPIGSALLVCALAGAAHGDTLAFEPTDLRTQAAGHRGSVALQGTRGRAGFKAIVPHGAGGRQCLNTARNAKRLRRALLVTGNARTRRSGRWTTYVYARATCAVQGVASPRPRPPKRPTPPTSPPVTPPTTPTPPSSGTPSDGKVGLSVIGLTSAHYNCDKVLAAFGQAPISFGYLERTFGEGRGCLNRLLSHPNFAAVRVHVFNGPCIRNRRCKDNEVLKGETTASLDAKLASGDRALLGKVQAELDRVKRALAPQMRAGKRYYVSGVLEHDMRDERAAKRMTAMVRATFAPLGFKIVNSPFTGRRNVGADLEEWHGDKPAVRAPCIVDPDGTEVSDFAAYAQRYKQCELVLGWNGPMNCNKPGATTFVDPRQRRDCPTSTTLYPFAQVIQGRRGPQAPTGPIAGCDTYDTFVDGAKRNNLWKPEADHQASKAVVMFKNAYLRTAKDLQVLDARSMRVVREVKTCNFPSFRPGTECGVYTEDGGAGRPFFRIQKPTAHQPVVVRLVLRDGKKVCFRDVADPSQRYD